MEEQLRQTIGRNLNLYNVEKKNGNWKSAHSHMKIVIQAMIDLHPLTAGKDRLDLESKMPETMDKFKFLCAKLNMKPKSEKISFKDIVGNEKEKKILQDDLKLYLGQESIALKVECPTILLYGQPGCGKSYFAEAIANETSSAYVSISAADMNSKYHGESEKAVEKIFAQARECSPSVLFFDEIHLLFSTKQSEEVSPGTKSVFLREMSSSANSGIVVLAASHQPWNIEAAILRRFRQKFFLSLPSTTERALILRKKMESSGLIVCVSAKDMEDIAKQLVEYTPSDLTVIAFAARRVAGRTTQSASFVTSAMYNGKQIHVACQEFDKGARKIVDMNKEGKDLNVRAVMMRPYLDYAVKSTKKSITNAEDLNKMKMFVKSCT
jgi:SpoVK/Ycf46/Vps4 family AAA+-type ATPase